MAITLMDAITIISFFIAVASVCVNVIQYYRHQSLRQEFKAYLSSSYNSDYMIARNCARMRKRYAEKYSDEQLLHYFWRELQTITGIVDAARGAAVFTARNQLGFTPIFLLPNRPNAVPELAEELGHSLETRGLPAKIDEYELQRPSKGELE
jgi:hypothetical protein